MKAIYLFAALLTGNYTIAQTVLKRDAVIKKEAAQPITTSKLKTVETTTTTMPPANTSTTTTTPPNTPPVPTPSPDGLTPRQRAMLESWPGYFLEKVKVLIYTGKDSKELPSTVLMNIERLGGYYPDEAGKTIELYHSNPNKTNTMEFKSNGVNEFHLNGNFVKPNGLSTETFNGAEGFKWPALSLKKIQDYGMKLKLSYSPNFFADAWDMDKVILVLEFNDILGRPHPSYGAREVHYLKGKKFTNADRQLSIDIDGLFNPKY